MIWAPPRTWARAISAAASKSPSATNRLNFRLPRTLVRSPIKTGRLSTSISSASTPDTSDFEWIGTRRGFLPSTARARARMCAGVVPQQPPTMLTQPSSRNRSSAAAMRSGVSG